MVRQLYVLEHTYERIAGYMQSKLIGIYRSEALANEALERSKLLEGFRDWPDKFTVRAIRVDKDLFPPAP